LKRLSTIIAQTSSFIVFAQFSFAQPLSEVSHYGENFGAVAFDGIKGITNEGTRLRTFEWPLFGSPQFQGSIEMGSVPVDLQIVNTTAYSLEQTGQFKIIDVSNGFSPTIIGELDWTDWKTALWVRRAEDYAYVLGCQGVRILDIRDKAHPSLVTILPGQCTYGIAGDGGYLYVARSLYSNIDSLLDIYSLADPGNPALIGSGPNIRPLTSHQFNSLAVFGDTAYVSGSGETYVLDVSDRTTPRLIKTIPGGGGETSLGISKGILHAANWQKSNFYALASPDAPDFLRESSGTYGNQASDVAANGNDSISARTDALWLSEVSIGNQNVIRTLTPKIGNAEALARKGNLLFVGGGPAIAVLEISNPLAPIELSSLYSRWTTALEISGSYLYNLSSWGAIEVYDTSNPYGINLLPVTYQIPNGQPYNSYNITIHDGLCAVSVGNQVMLYNALPNGQLAKISTVDLPTTINAVDFFQNALYVTTSDGQLMTFDISDRVIPNLLSTLSAFPAQQILGISSLCKVDSNYLHTMFSRRGYALYDISSPLEPVLVDTLPLFEQDAVSLDVDGRWAYFACIGWNGKNGIRVLDLANPQDVKLAHSRNTTSFAKDILHHDGFVFSAENRGCLRIRSAMTASAAVLDWSIY